MVEPRKPMAPNSFMISRSNFSWRAAISTRGCSFSWQNACAASTMARSSSLSCSDRKNGSSQLNLTFMALVLVVLVEFAKCRGLSPAVCLALVLLDGHEYLSNTDYRFNDTLFISNLDSSVDRLVPPTSSHAVSYTHLRAHAT